MMDKCELIYVDNHIYTKPPFNNGEHELISDFRIINETPFCLKAERLYFLKCYYLCRNFTDDLEMREMIRLYAKFFGIEISSNYYRETSGITKLIDYWIGGNSEENNSLKKKIKDLEKQIKEEI